MKIRPALLARRHSSGGLLTSRLAYVLPAVFALLVSILGQWWNPHSFDTDEGINLGKGALVAAGFHPYADIWNDQPPILTYVLAAVQWLLPWNVGAARVTILLFACLLLHAVFRVVERSAGAGAAVTSLILLATAPLIWRLSISVMIGLPAVALAMWGCAIVYRRDRPGLVRGTIAGLVFALSLQTKLFAAAALPAFLAIAYLSGEEETPARRIKMVAVALSGAAVGFVAIEIMVGVPLWRQLVEPHIAAEVRSEYSFFDCALRLAEYLIQQPFILLSALLALIPAWRPVSELRKAWLIWTGCALVVLLGHTPLRYHHVLLLVVPLACIGGEALWRFLKANWHGWSAIARYKIPLAPVLAIALFAYSVLLLRPFHNDRTTGANTVTERLLNFAQKDPWVATDQPFEAFQAGLLVLPELVVFSVKRIETNNLTPEMLMDVIATRRPGQVLLKRSHAAPPLLEYLDTSYVRVGRRSLHYARPDVADNTSG